MSVMFQSQVRSPSPLSSASSPSAELTQHELSNTSSTPPSFLSAPSLASPALPPAPLLQPFAPLGTSPRPCPPSICTHVSPSTLSPLSGLIPSPSLTTAPAAASPQARLLLAYSKVALATLILRIPPVYVMSRDDYSPQSAANPQQAIPLKVRIMGSVQPTAHDHSIASTSTPASLAPIKPQHHDVAGSEIFLAAKDLCALIHTRKGNVAKSIGGFAEWEKARMAVLCPRSNGSVSTHILTVLSLAGMYRLLNASRSPLAPVVMKVLYEVVDNLLDDEAARRNKHLAEEEAEVLRAAAASAKAEEDEARSDALPSTSSSSSSPASSSSASSPSTSLPLSAEQLLSNARTLASPSTSVQLAGAVSGLEQSFPPQSSNAQSAPRAMSKKGRKEDRGDDDEATQVSGPVHIYSLVSLSDGVGFVRLKLKDQASVRQELRRMREGPTGIQVADDKQATIDGAERAHAAAEVSRARNEGGSSVGATVGRQVASRRAAAVLPTVATPAMAVSSGFDRPTVAAVPVSVDKENERERWRLDFRQQQRDECASIDDARQRLIDEVARALQSTVSFYACWRESSESVSPVSTTVATAFPPVLAPHNCREHATDTGNHYLFDDNIACEALSQRAAGTKIGAVSHKLRLVRISAPCCVVDTT